GRLPRQWRPYAWMVLVLGFAALLPLGYAFATSGGGQRRATSTPCLQSLRLMVQTGALEKLLGPENLILVAPENAGGEILFFTPYRIIASNYHREGQGLAALHRITRATTAAEAETRLAARAVDAVLYCPDVTTPESWLRQTDEPGMIPGGFTEIPLGSTPAILLKNNMLNR
ncbi:MAG TPA: hypothetical protein VEF76_10020, partial [Patescibacteria group bacterium]|nr:hypothetical protein [Patescibacteria group bacterium]